MQLIPPEIEERIIYCPVTGHWYWMGRWNSGNGYSKTCWQGRTWTVSRLIWTFVNGPIPEGHHLDHLSFCRWRPCIRPDHLEPVTPAENTRRGEAVLITKEIWAEAMACPSISPD